MKTITHYRQAVINRKPKGMLLITMITVAAFLTGVMVGSAIPLVGQVDDIAATVSGYFQGLLHGGLNLDLSLPAEWVVNAYSIIKSAFLLDMNFVLAGP